MSTTISITPNNQIHIPLYIRKKLNLTAPSKATISVEDNRIIIEPITNNAVLNLAGSYKSVVKNNKDIDVENIRDLIDYTNA